MTVLLRIFTPIYSSFLQMFMTVATAQVVGFKLGLFGIPAPIFVQWAVGVSIFSAVSSFAIWVTLFPAITLLNTRLTMGAASSSKIQFWRSCGSWR